MNAGAALIGSNSAIQRIGMSSPGGDKTCRQIYLLRDSLPGTPRAMSTVNGVNGTNGVNLNEAKESNVLPRST